jgi:hypothetical protein
MLCLKKLLLVATVISSSFLYSNNNESEVKIDQESWLLEHLNEKDSPKWASNYILNLDEKISDANAKVYFRRFIADRNTRIDNLLKFVEYLSLAGYPEQVVLENNISGNISAIDVYKAVYFAVTYTIMDGLPSGPQS